METLSQQQNWTWKRRAGVQLWKHSSHGKPRQHYASQAKPYGDRKDSLISEEGWHTLPSTAEKEDFVSWSACATVCCSKSASPTVGRERTSKVLAGGAREGAEPWAKNCSLAKQALTSLETRPPAQPCPRSWVMRRRRRCHAEPSPCSLPPTPGSGREEQGVHSDSPGINQKTVRRLPSVCPAHLPAEEQRFEQWHFSWSPGWKSDSPLCSC